MLFLLFRWTHSLGEKYIETILANNNIVYQKEISFSDLIERVKNYYGWIALGAGLFVSMVARGGLDLLANDPHLTTALVMGTILAVVFLQGVAVGPLIGAGIAYMVMHIVDYFIKFF